MRRPVYHGPVLTLPGPVADVGWLRDHLGHPALHRGISAGGRSSERSHPAATGARR
jgi:hypothetical protein